MIGSDVRVAILRLGNEDKVVRSVIRQQECSQEFAFELGDGALGLAAFMVWSGHPRYAVTTTIAAIGTLAVSLLYRRRAKSHTEEAVETSDQQNQNHKAEHSVFPLPGTRGQD